MTRLSEGTFEFRGAPVASSGAGAAGTGIAAAAGLPTGQSKPNSPGSSGTEGGPNVCNFPAPAPTLAIIAAAMTDFPNPPAEAAGCAEGDAALEAAVTNTNTRGGGGGDHHRERSSVRNNWTDSFADATIGTAAAAADKWAAGPAGSTSRKTAGGELDRHCKVRFVERLSSVIACVESDAANASAGAGTGTCSGNGDDPIDDSNLNHAQLSAMDDNRLDKVLDGLLVRVVEGLVEMTGDCTSSSYEMQEELNSPDVSGFTLLHYAALYNLRSLCPLLFSGGANPDTPTGRGRLTPLHVACGAGHWAVVELLVRNGCAVRVRDSLGYFPSDHARRGGFPEVAQWLEEKTTGADRRKVDEWRASDERRRRRSADIEGEEAGSDLSSSSDRLSEESARDVFGEPQ